MASAAQESPLLGLCDGGIDSSRHRTSFLTSKVGGRPDWSPLACRQLHPRCGRCGAPLVLVVQVYCPLQASPYHRNLHLFACPGVECSGSSDSWKVLRSQCLEEEAAAPSRPDPAQEAPLAATDWCDTADDWGVEEEEEGGWGGGVERKSQVEAEAGGAVGVSSRLQDLSLGDQEDEEEEVPVLPAFFISVVEESDVAGEELDLRHAEQLLREYERREGVAVAELEGGGGGGGGGGGEEKYEKTRARHGDAVFSRFMKKISACPQQILRYCRGGDPLFISEPPSGPLAPPCGRLAPPCGRLAPPCGSCGGSRTFELQLMPALVDLLRGEVEFGTVLVYTCTSSCWTAGSGSALEEVCWVQTDPDQQLFK